MEHALSFGEFLFWAFQAVLTLLVGVLGWFLRDMKEDLKALANRLQTQEVDLPKSYIRKSDLDAKLTEIGQRLIRIEDKLDHKADK